MSFGEIGASVLKGVASAAGSKGSGSQNLYNKLQERRKNRVAKQQSSSSNSSDPGDMPSYKRGGKVKHTGKAYLHKGERVLTKRQARKYSRGK